MKRAVYYAAFLIIPLSLRGQTNQLYGLWKDNETQHFISADKNTGDRTIISSVHGNIGVVIGSSTIYEDSSQYMFVGIENNPIEYRIYTINIRDGSVISNPINPEGTGEYEFDPVTKKLYGLFMDNGTQNFVSVDNITGERTLIKSIPGNPGIINGSSTFYADSGQYIFIGIESNLTTQRLYTIDINDGSVISNPLNPEGAGEYEFDPVTKKIYGLWRDNGTQNFVSVEKFTGKKNVISIIPSNPGLVNGSSTFCSDSGQYIFIGIESNSMVAKIYSIDITDGSILASPVNSISAGEYECACSKPEISNVVTANFYEDIEIFPNPTKNCFTINNIYETAFIEVYDINGHLIQKFEPDQVDGYFSCDLPRLLNGTYLVKLIDFKGQHVIRKIVINN